MNYILLINIYIFFKPRYGQNNTIENNKFIFTQYIILHINVY